MTSLYDEVTIYLKKSGKYLKLNAMGKLILEKLLFATSEDEAIKDLGYLLDLPNNSDTGQLVRYYRTFEKELLEKGILEEVYK